MTPKCIRVSQAPGNIAHQIVIAAMLLSVLPILSLSYLYIANTLHTGFPTMEGKELLVASILLMITSGGMLLMEHAKNISKLRQYTAHATRNAFPKRKMDSLETASLHDLKYIENCLRCSLKELRRQGERLEHKQRIEKDLRDRIDQHQLALRDICHQIEKPAATMKLRLSVLNRLDLPLEQKVQIEECNKDIESILKIPSLLENNAGALSSKAS